MAFVFRKEEQEKVKQQMVLPETEVSRPIWQEIIHFGIIVLILIFANWAKPALDSGFWFQIYQTKWIITAILGIIFGIVLNRIFKMKIWKIVLVTILIIAAHFLFRENTMITFIVGIIGLSYFTSTSEDELGDWFSATWGFAK